MLVWSNQITNNSHWWHNNNQQSPWKQWFPWQPDSNWMKPVMYGWKRHRKSVSRYCSGSHELPVVGYLNLWALWVWKRSCWMMMMKPFSSSSSPSVTTCSFSIALNTLRMWHHQEPSSRGRSTCQLSELWLVQSLNPQSLSLCCTVCIDLNMKPSSQFLLDLNLDQMCIMLVCTACGIRLVGDKLILENSF